MVIHTGERSQMYIVCDKSFKCGKFRLARTKNWRNLMANCLHALCGRKCIQMHDDGFVWFRCWVAVCSLIDIISVLYARHDIWVYAVTRWHCLAYEGQSSIKAYFIQSKHCSSKGFGTCSIFRIQNIFFTACKYYREYLQAIILIQRTVRMPIFPLSQSLNQNRNQFNHHLKSIIQNCNDFPHFLTSGSYKYGCYKFLLTLIMHTVANNHSCTTKF